MGATEDAVAYSKQAEVISALLWGPKTIEEIVEITGMPEIQARRFLYQLANSGVLKSERIKLESKRQWVKLHTLIRHDGRPCHA